MTILFSRGHFRTEFGTKKVFVLQVVEIFFHLFFFLSLTKRKPHTPHTKKKKMLWLQLGLLIGGALRSITTAQPRASATRPHEEMEASTALEGFLDVAHYMDNDPTSCWRVGWSKFPSMPPSNPDSSPSGVMSLHTEVREYHRKNKNNNNNTMCTATTSSELSGKKDGDDSSTNIEVNPKVRDDPGGVHSGYKKGSDGVGVPLLRLTGFFPNVTTQQVKEQLVDVSKRWKWDPYYCYFVDLFAEEGSGMEVEYSSKETEKVTVVGKNKDAGKSCRIEKVDRELSSSGLQLLPHRVECDLDWNVAAVTTWRNSSHTLRQCMRKNFKMEEHSMLFHYSEAPPVLKAFGVKTRLFVYERLISSCSVSSLTRGSSSASTGEGEMVYSVLFRSPPNSSVFFSSGTNKLQTSNSASTPLVDPVYPAALQRTLQLVTERLLMSKTQQTKSNSNRTVLGETSTSCSNLRVATVFMHYQEIFLVPFSFVSSPNPKVAPPVASNDNMRTITTTSSPSHFHSVLIDAKNIWGSNLGSVLQELPPEGLHMLRHQTSEESRHIDDGRKVQGGTLMVMTSCNDAKLPTDSFWFRLAQDYMSQYIVNNVYRHLIQALDES